MTKPDFLYNQGMKILQYSSIQAQSEGIGWQREGSMIAYYKNGIQKKGATYYTLTFSITTKRIKKIVTEIC